MAKFDAETLRELREVQEVRIRTEKHPKSAVVIWVVVAEDEVFVRSWRGAKGRWFRDLAAGGPATLEFAGRRLTVQALPGERSRSGRPGQPRVPEQVSAEHPCAGDGALRSLADHAAARTPLIRFAPP
jgi:FAD/FMN-containing dehydrogenase